MAKEQMTGTLAITIRPMFCGCLINDYTHKELCTLVLIIHLKKNEIFLDI